MHRVAYVNLAVTTKQELTVILQKKMRKKFEHELKKVINH